MTGRIRATVILIVSLMPGAAAAAQATRLSGAVTTRTDGSSVADAVITIPGTSIRTTTGSDGRYSLDLPDSLARAGRVQLRVEAPRLPPGTYDVTLAQNATTGFDIVLGPGVDDMMATMGPDLLPGAATAATTPPAETTAAATALPGTAVGKHSRHSQSASGTGKSSGTHSRGAGHHQQSSGGHSRSGGQKHHSKGGKG